MATTFTVLAVLAAGGSVLTALNGPDSYGDKATIAVCGFVFIVATIAAVALK